MKQQTPFAIISAERTERTDRQNAYLSGQLVNALNANGLDFVGVRGYYKGASERSYLVLLPSTDGAVADVVLSLARELGQESILIVSASRTVYLRTLSPIPERYPTTNYSDEWLGSWRQVDSEYTGEAWTEIADGRRYAAIR